jgi:hypothetical protein
MKRLQAHAADARTLSIAHKNQDAAAYFKQLADDITEGLVELKRLQARVVELFEQDEGRAGPNVS